MNFFRSNLRTLMLAKPVSKSNADGIILFAMLKQPVKNPELAGATLKFALIPPVFCRDAKMSDLSFGVRQLFYSFLSL